LVPQSAVAAQATFVPTSTLEPTAVPSLSPAPTESGSITTVPTLVPTAAAVPLTAASPTASAPVVPTTSVLPNVDDPNRAGPIDGNIHILAAKSATWYRFDYALSDTGARQQRIVTLVNGNNSGVRFEVWTPDNLNNWWEKKPVGRSTSFQIDCDTGAASDQGACQSNDLAWAGSFNVGWAVYVRVVNENDHPSLFQLTLK
jgi:hypothetical protein